jgi:hypothetical protein
MMRADLASGKTTVANLLVELGYERVRFADPLYRLVEYLRSNEGRHRAAALAVSLFPVTDPHGRVEALVELSRLYFEHKASLESGEKPRAFMQEFGTNVCRRLRPDVWVEYLLRQLEPGACYVCDDARFPNEAQGLKDAGWTLVRCCVPEEQRLQRLTDLYGGYDEAALNHPSETALDDWGAWDIELDTSVPIEAQGERLREALDGWRGRTI